MILEERLAVFERLSPTTQAFLLKVARRIAEGYEGEITLQVTKRENQQRGGISEIDWHQRDRGGDIWRR